MEILLFIGGVIVGGLLMWFRLTRQKPIGTLRVDRSDPDSTPYLFLEIDHGKAYLIERSKQITLRVGLSQK